MWAEAGEGRVRDGGAEVTAGHDGTGRQLGALGELVPCEMFVVFFFGFGAEEAGVAGEDEVVLMRPGVGEFEELEELGGWGEI